MLRTVISTTRHKSLGTVDCLYIKHSVVCSGILFLFHLKIGVRKNGHKCPSGTKRVKHMPEFDSWLAGKYSRPTQVPKPKQKVKQSFR